MPLSPCWGGSKAMPALPAPSLPAQRGHSGGHQSHLCPPYLCDPMSSLIQPAAAAVSRRRAGIQHHKTSPVRAPDAGACARDPLLPSIHPSLPPSPPKKSPNLPGNTKLGSFSQPLHPRPMRALPMRSCEGQELPELRVFPFSPSSSSPARCFSARGRRGGVGWSSEAAPVLSQAEQNTLQKNTKGEVSSPLKGALLVITGGSALL